MNESFEDILEKGEKIVKTYKPNSKKFWCSVNLITFVSVVCAIGWTPLMLLDEEVAPVACWIMLISAAATPIIWLLVIVFAKMYYNKRLYAYTSRRVLIRGGIIGVDYKSLQLGDLNATKVYVSWLDKLVGKDTGTIRFGSPSAPLVETANGMSNPYLFAHIEKPYEIMREIREFIDVSIKKS